eukprot:c25874_g1_i1.p1 GENE.c25874_g1_i1~~c25874_g1_i1.p1  ORF type:complete len:320 (-),score=70.50 c25874_g1_i1:111-953(-)
MCNRFGSTEKSSSKFKFTHLNIQNVRGIEILPVVRFEPLVSDLKQIPENPSKHCPAPSVPTVSLVTAAFGDKLPLLGDLCTRWPGDIVVAFWGNLSLTEHPWTKSCESSNRTVRIVQVVGPLIPNFVRNVAIQHTKSSHYFFLEIELWPSTGLFQKIQELLSDPNHAPNANHAIILEHISTDEIENQKPQIVDCIPMNEEERAHVLLVQKCDFTPKFPEVYSGESPSLMVYLAQYAGYTFSSIPAILSTIFYIQTKTDFQCAISRFVAAYGDTPVVPTCL